MTKVMKQVKFLNVGIHRLAMEDLLERLKNGGVVYTPNVDHLMKLQRDRDFYQVYQEADYRVCDSKVLIYMSQFLGTPIKHKIAGSDLLPAFCNYYKHDESIKIFLLGAKEGVAKIAQEKINAVVGRDIVVGVYSPSFGFEKQPEECKQIIDLINSSGATALVVGLGAPKQEIWISNYKNQLKNVTIFFAVGASIDFEAGTIKRAPRWMSETGLEWSHRLLQEPKRLWKRYLLDAIPFLWLVLKQRLRLYKNPWAELKIPQNGNLAKF